MLLADLIEYNGWKPDLKKLEALRSAGEMQQEHYAEAWAWVYFLHATRRRSGGELLTRVSHSTCANMARPPPLSERLAAQHIEPQRTLAEYIVTLKAEPQQRVE